MKQKDIAIVIVVVFMSAVFSWFASSAIFVKPKDRQQQVEVVQAITTDFPQPDTRYFSSNSFDPTKLITISQNNNNNPFNSNSSH